MRPSWINLYQIRFDLVWTFSQIRSILWGMVKDEAPERVLFCLPHPHNVLGDLISQFLNMGHTQNLCRNNNAPLFFPPSTKHREKNVYTAGCKTTWNHRNIKSYGAFGPLTSPPPCSGEKKSKLKHPWQKAIQTLVQCNMRSPPPFSVINSTVEVLLLLGRFSYNLTGICIHVA